MVGLLEEGGRGGVATRPLGEFVWRGWGLAPECRGLLCNAFLGATTVMVMFAGRGQG